MSRMVLVTGGCRSGKSSFALGMGLAQQGRHAFIATAPKTVGMDERISRHQQERPGEWETFEEECDLSQMILSMSRFDAVVLDCVSLWVSNLLYHHEQDPYSMEEPTEDRILLLADELVRSLQARAALSVIVSNEVGFGLYPENSLARKFCDLLGRCNQQLASHADEVVLMVSGLPVVLKEQSVQ